MVSGWRQSHFRASIPLPIAPAAAYAGASDNESRRGMAKEPCRPNSDRGPSASFCGSLLQIPRCRGLPQSTPITRKSTVQTRVAGRKMVAEKCRRFCVILRVHCGKFTEAEVWPRSPAEYADPRKSRPSRPRRSHVTAPNLSANRLGLRLYRPVLIPSVSIRVIRG